VIGEWLPPPRALREQCIALAGLYQAVAQVQACARDGEPSNAAALCTCLASVLRIDADSAEEVFGDVTALAPGLASLGAHLTQPGTVLHLEQTRYALGLMHLERRLAASAGTTQRLGDALRALAQQGEALAVDDPWMIERMAALYVDHISPLGPRILVSGEPVHLKAPDNAARIRAALLAGLRAAVLWRQFGGSRLKLALFRAAFARQTAALARAPVA
jgi:high frequency lysogenization protein